MRTSPWIGLCSGLALLAAARVASASGHAEPLRFELVRDRDLGGTREVRVFRGARLAETLPTPDIVTEEAPFAVHLADFDGDGHPDLVISPRRDDIRGARTWIVFRFDPRAGRFRRRSERYYLHARGPRGVPAPGLHVDALLGMDVPAARTFPLVIRRGGEIVSVIPYDEMTEPLDRDEPLASVDIDFDGHPDLAMRGNGTSNWWGRFWRFDPRSGRYVPWRAGSELANPKFDPQRHEVVTWESHGLAGQAYREAVYHLADGKLTLLWDREQGIGAIDREPQPQGPAGRPVFTWKVRRRVDGRLKVVCRAYVDDVRPRPKVLKMVTGSEADCQRPAGSVEP